MSDYLRTRVTEREVVDRRMELTLETIDGNEKSIKYSIPFILPPIITGSQIDFYQGHVTECREKRINHNSYVEAEFYTEEGLHIATIPGKHLKLLEEALKADEKRKTPS